MKNKRLILLLILLPMAAAPLYAAEKPQKNTLKIYLPREVTIEGDIPRIGQVGIVRGSDPLVSKAGDIVVGRFSTPDQNLVINRNIILSRLACNGIPASRVTLTGAEETVIKRQHELITGVQFAEKATDFLRQNLPDDSICQFDALRTPDDLVLPLAGDNIKMLCRLVRNGARNQCKVQVTVFQDDRQITQRDVTFRFRYQCRKVIAKTSIARGELLSTENVNIEKGMSTFPEPPQWTAPYGRVALRPLAAGTIITDNMTAPPQPEVILKRNQNVTIKIESAGLVATAIGKVLQDGVVGEYIKVQNIDSNIIVLAKVNQDGTVEPVF